MSKIILHIDFNSFFASVEQQANPFLRGKAIAVGGKSKKSVDGSKAYTQRQRYDIQHDLQLERTVVTTASREARQRGVKTAISSIEAKRICPDLILIPGDPHKYSKITNTFLTILHRHCDAVEQFSTDEAFADVTIAAGDYFGAVILAQMIRSDIKKECGIACTASIGIAPNKVVAKLACESVKPNGLTCVMPDEVESFVLSCDLQDVCGIGLRIERRLHALGISSIKTLKNTPLSQLVDEFKSYGYFLHAVAHGLGDDTVNDTIEDPKSIGHSYTYPYDLSEPSNIQRQLLALADRIAWRMRRDGFIGTNLSVFVRYKGFNGIRTQKRYKEPMEDGLNIYRNVWKLIELIRDPDIPIRLLGISVSGLLKTEMPSTLFPKERKMHHVLHALDVIQSKFGSGIWQRAATVGTVFKERTSGWHYDHKN